MSEQSFTTSFTVDQSPEQVYAAINDVRAWWTGQITGPTDKLGGEFVYRYKTIHESTQKVTELVPGRKVVWEVTKAKLPFENQEEWVGTKIVFEITRTAKKKTEVRFTHVGLVPAIQCYGDCSGAWGFLVTENLRGFITKGKATAGDAFAEG